MTKNVWSITLEDSLHTIEFERGVWSTKHTIRVDGQVVHEGRSYATDFGTDDSFQIGKHACTVHTRTHWTKIDYDLSIDGLSITTGQPASLRVPLPKWAWIFIVACIAVPIITLGGALAGAIGFGGAYVCLDIARRSAWQTRRRVVVSAGVTLLCYALLVLLLVTTTNVRTLFSAGQTAWQEFTSTAGGYSIVMPGKPIEQKQAVDTTGGSVDLYSASIDNQSGSYIAMYADYPANAVGQSDPQKLLDGSRDGAVANSGGTLVSEQKLLLNNNPGREIQVSVPAQNGQAAVLIVDRYFLVGQRLYQTMAIIPNSQQVSADARKFLDSFKLLKQ